MHFYGPCEGRPSNASRTRNRAVLTGDSWPIENKRAIDKYLFFGKCPLIGDALMGMAGVAM